ncbi:MAG: hypothetical protein A3F40_01125 [Chlamydiae bacterium RIFCSPHIGHO2_12_FULL_27_8]|nr:MAG: hypothetical protein A3F40_01125 [Chlamydiae bacterium RIFCSPHIGHO2_12_FULL_27_8]OGN65423.1 MAG: hypothetical protein A2888_02010 [Chlamydiae bacterium RIFCSPLOWO2_01_FULL_28_7]
MIPSKKIDMHAFVIIETLRLNGHLAFLVGGSVRDLLLNVRPKDFDIATSAKPEEIKKVFYKKCILIGKRFRLAHVRFGKKIIEVSTFRSGETEEQSLILKDNIYGSPNEDALRRDFTINGLFYDPEVQTIIDYVDGYSDVEKRILRTIGDAKARFIQDPVRMIRLIKFKARFEDFTIEKNTYNALIECKDEINKSSPARILEELFKMLNSVSSFRFFYLLNESGILSILSKNLSKFFNDYKNIGLLLKELDKINNENYPHELERAVLISIFLFDPLKDRLEKNYKDKINQFHLGIIASESFKIINDVFRPFFLIPRKMKAEIVSILMNQFRIFPLFNIQNKIKIPKDPFFYLSLKFYKIRCMLDPNLLSNYEMWSEKFSKRKNH